MRTGKSNQVPEQSLKKSSKGTSSSKTNSRPTQGKTKKGDPAKKLESTKKGNSGKKLESTKKVDSGKKVAVEHSMNMVDYINKNIYYLNNFELTRIADNLKIPYKIYAEKTLGTLKKTNKKDPKIIIIKRILKYIKSGTIASPTVYYNKVMSGSNVNSKFKSHPEHNTGSKSASIVGGKAKSNNKESSLNKKSLIYYDTYKNNNHKIVELMAQLTDNKFKFGTTSNDILRDYWSQGKVITFEKFASEWLKTTNSKKPHPEMRYLYDMKKNPDIVDWKKYRDQIAANVITCVSDHISNQK
jgi:hypothetical protein